MTGNCVTASQGKLVEIGINSFFEYNNIRNRYELALNRLSSENTYISIFGPQNIRHLEVFLSDSRIKIIYEAKKAVNRREGHGDLPRNTLVVWELAGETP